MMKRDNYAMGDPGVHFWITRAVGRAMGVNFSEAMAEGRLNPSDYAEMVNTCRACALVGGCQHWLATAGAVQSGRAYEGCPNAALLERLQ